MATCLYRLGGWAFDNRRKVLLGWVVVLALVIASASAFSGTFSSKFEVPGTESQRAQDLLYEKYPGAGGASARVVYVAPQGEKLTDPENKAAIMESAEKASKAKDVSQVVDPYTAKAISKDGRIAYSDVIYPMPADEVDDPAREALEKSAEPAETAGMQVEFGGGLVTEEHRSTAELLGIMVGFLVLAITLGIAGGRGSAPADRSDRGRHCSRRSHRPHRRCSSSPRRRRRSPRCSGWRSASTMRCSSCPAIARTSATGWNPVKRPPRQAGRQAARSCSPA